MRSCLLCFDSVWAMQYKFLRFCRLPSCGGWRGLMWFSGFGLHVGCFWFGWCCDFVLDVLPQYRFLGLLWWICGCLGAFVSGRVAAW